MVSLTRDDPYTPSFPLLAFWPPPSLPISKHRLKLCQERVHRDLALEKHGGMEGPSCTLDCSGFWDVGIDLPRPLDIQQTKDAESSENPHVLAVAVAVVSVDEDEGERGVVP